MPIYEYQCQKCGHHHEALQKLSDPHLRQCPECGRKALKRLVSAVRFRLAGSGWYETDFKSDKESKRNLQEKGDKEESSAAPAADTAKSDAKETASPAAKPDAPIAKADVPAAGKGEGASRSRRAMVTKPANAPARSKARVGRKPARPAKASSARRR